MKSTLQLYAYSVTTQGELKMQNTNKVSPANRCTQATESLALALMCWAAGPYGLISVEQKQPRKGLERKAG